MKIYLYVTVTISATRPTQWKKTSHNYRLKRSSSTDSTVENTGASVDLRGLIAANHRTSATERSRPSSCFHLPGRVCENNSANEFLAAAFHFNDEVNQRVADIIL